MQYDICKCVENRMNTWERLASVIEKAQQTSDGGSSSEANVQPPSGLLVDKEGCK